MDQNRFDRLARVAGSRVNRRAGLGVALAAALGLDPAPETAAKPRCKPPRKLCGSKCTAVKTDRKNCGRCGRDCGVGRRCKDGRCLSLPDACTGQPDNARCGANRIGRCLAGVCNPKPTCWEEGTVVENGAPGCVGCCSQRCVSNYGFPFVCTDSDPGDPCYSHRFCLDGRACIGYRCGDPLVCPPEAPTLCVVEIRQNTYLERAGCVPASCGFGSGDNRCGVRCNPQNDNPCGDCEPHLVCDFDPDAPDDGYRCRPRVPPSTCPPAAPQLCAVGSAVGCVPNSCGDGGGCGARCNPQNKNACGNCEPYLVCDFDQNNQEDGYRCRPQVPPRPIG